MYRFSRLASKILDNVNQIDRLYCHRFQRSFSCSYYLQGDYLSGSVAAKGSGSDTFYTEAHEWVKMKNENVGIVGLTDFAVNALGDLVYLELPEIDQELELGETCGVVESVKAASDIYSPVSGTVESVNSAAADTPETVKEDPFGEGWLFEIKLSDTSELDGLLSKDKYKDFLKGLE